MIKIRLNRDNTLTVSMKLTTGKFLCLVRAIHALAETRSILAEELFAAVKRAATEAGCAELASNL